jgi:hypothetical protein
LKDDCGNTIATAKDSEKEAVNNLFNDRRPIHATFSEILISRVKVARGAAAFNTHVRNRT